ncbi:hypothetical protein FRC08_013003 [Ceratobasidium sp. 394]|nr:hypothetical protein FRC08_013003 [Ceratobasidium sp. 394]KAG9096708.1 hypothetical protein FS749_007903 [Ceratobasidium sp. UAMH 11750]
MKHLPLPSERSLKQHRSQNPGFPVGATSRNVNRAVQHLERLEYSGPVNICDDTQLLSKFSPYYDSAVNKWYLLGGVDDPIEIDEC